MKKVAVSTDTNSSLSVEDAEKLGVYLLPMPFNVDGTDYFEDVNCTYEHFFEMLAAGSDVSTSQPSPASLTEMWEKALETHDELIHIPMSSAISSSTATAKALSAEYEGRVFVADNRRISPTQYQSVLDALDMVKAGMGAADICKALEDTAYDASIYLAVNTLELLKKSGRVTAAGAAVAAILNIKPVLQIQGGKLDAFAKARGMANAEKVILDAIDKDLNDRFKNIPVKIETAYSGELAPALEWQKTVMARFPGYEVKLHKLPISICCHVGAGVKAAVCMRYFENGKEAE